jgi:hypothetical protein
MVIDGEMKVSKAENLKKKKTIYGKKEFFGFFFF